MLLPRALRFFTIVCLLLAQVRSVLAQTPGPKPQIKVIRYMPGGQDTVDSYLQPPDRLQVGEKLLHSTTSDRLFRIGDWALVHGTLEEGQIREIFTDGTTTYLALDSEFLDRIGGVAYIDAAEASPEVEALYGIRAGGHIDRDEFQQMIMPPNEPSHMGHQRPTAGIPRDSVLKVRRVYQAPDGFAIFSGVWWQLSTDQQRDRYALRVFGFALNSQRAKSLSCRDFIKEDLP